MGRRPAVRQAAGFGARPGDVQASLYFGLENQAPWVPRRALAGGTGRARGAERANGMVSLTYVAGNCPVGDGARAVEAFPVRLAAPSRPERQP